MKGQILHIDAQSGDGVITGADGRRYAFREANLLGSGQIARAGVWVDFQTRGDAAVEIYPDPNTPHAVAYGEKNKFVAGLLALFLGSLGVHKLYLGFNRAGLIMLEEAKGILVSALGVLAVHYGYSRPPAREIAR